MRLFFLKQILRLFKASVLFFLVCVGMFGFIIFAIFSPFFELKKIVVERDDPYVNVDAVQEALQSFYGQNLLFMTDDEIKNILKEQFPEFRSVQVKEHWPDEIALNIKVSPPLFTLLNKETANFSTISEDGVILESSPNQDLPVLNIYGYDKLILPRVAFMEKEDLARIQESRYTLEESMKLPVKEIRVYPIAQELHFVLQNGTVIWLDLMADHQEQLRKLDLASSRIGIYTEPLHHVDLRIPDHLFWK
ncbi:MAG TPA: FtsQ-type POTRA domain-containing protein [Candidatus Gracilibacteria bacterium]